MKPPPCRALITPRCSAVAAALAMVFSVSQPAESAVPRDCRQLILAVADDWDSTRASLACWERSSARAPWKPAVFEGPVPVLLGSKGMAWGRGVASTEDPSATFKREGDERAPAGCFKIGRVFGYATRAPEGCTVPYRQVTRWDAWIDDPAHAHYNRHFVADPANPPPWFEEHRMRLGDFAYEWMIEVRHNADPPRPGFGSAIFFHIRRGPNRPSHGCTTMRKEDLLRVIGWLDERQEPHYVLLPTAVYRERAASWSLPK